MDEGFSFVHYGCHPCMLKNLINPLWIDDTTNFMNVIQSKNNLASMEDKIWMNVMNIDEYIWMEMKVKSIAKNIWDQHFFGAKFCQNANLIFGLWLSRRFFW